MSEKHVRGGLRALRHQRLRFDDGWLPVSAIISGATDVVFASRIDFDRRCRDYLSARQAAKTDLQPTLSR